MDLKLRVTQGKNVGQEVSVPGKMFLIGRAEDCHLRAGSDLISRHHCVIIVENDYLAVRDFGSKNGTSVNGERVCGECELKHGDELRVGPLEFLVQVSQGALGGKKKPPVHDAKEAAARTAAASPADDDGDVSKWLSQPAPTVNNSTQDTQMVRIGDTDEIDVGSTKEFGLPEPAAANPAVPAPKSPAVTAKQAAPQQPAPKQQAPKQPAAAPQQAVAAVASEPVAAATEEAAPGEDPAAPADDSAAPEKRRFFGGAKKTYGKLPTQPSQDSKSSVEAASNILSKLRKRR